MEMEAANRRVGSASASEERWIGCERMPMQGVKDISSGFEVPSSCWCWRRGISILIQHGFTNILSLCFLGHNCSCKDYSLPPEIFYETSELLELCLSHRVQSKFCKNLLPLWGQVNLVQLTRPLSLLGHVKTKGL